MSTIPHGYRILALPVLPEMTHPDYFDVVARIAAIRKAAEPWLLSDEPGEPPLVANWRCNAMRRRTAELNTERRLARLRFWAAREASRGQPVVIPTSVT